MNDKEDKMNKTYKGVYTVEAAFIFSICFLIIGSVMCLTYDIYSESYKYIIGLKSEEHDAVERFRQIDAAKDVINGITKDKES